MATLLLLAAVLMLLFQLDGAMPPSQKICKQDVDVGFLLDSSGSLKKNYRDEKYFLKKLAASFGISKDGSRAGVITFSSNSKFSIKFKDYSDISSFNAAVDAIPFMGYATRIDRALRLTQKELFSPENGARPGIPKVLIILTDGAQSKDFGSEDPGDVADELRTAGVNIIVVGIGRSTNLGELEHMAGGKGMSYSADSFDELIGGEFIKKLTGKSCDAAVIMTPGPVSCHGKTDIGFIVDSSGSTFQHFGDTIKFVKTMAEKFGISKDGIRASVISFNEFANHDIKLKDHADLFSFNKAVDRIKATHFSTRIDKGLELAKSEMFASKHGGRVGASKIIIVLTDGAQTPRKEDLVTNAAWEIIKSDITMFVVGIGNNISEMDLLRISRNHDHIFTVRSFESLTDKKFIDSLIARSCKVAAANP